MIVALRMENRAMAGNLTSEEPEWVTADLKSVKAAGTDGFSLTFYVFLNRKNVLYFHETFLFSFQNAELLKIMTHIPELQSHVNSPELKLVIYQ